jgi:hypothetical protein
VRLKELRDLAFCVQGEGAMTGYAENGVPVKSPEKRETSIDLTGKP